MRALTHENLQPVDHLAACLSGSGADRATSSPVNEINHGGEGLQISSHDWELVECLSGFTSQTCGRAVDEYLCRPNPVHRGTNAEVVDEGTGSLASAIPDLDSFNTKSP
jgi:hypothetical protein